MCAADRASEDRIARSWRGCSSRLAGEARQVWGVAAGVDEYEAVLSRLRTFRELHRQHVDQEGRKRDGASARGGLRLRKPLKPPAHFDKLACDNDGAMHEIDVPAPQPHHL